MDALCPLPYVKTHHTAHNTPMSSRRVLKVAQAIKEVVSMAILTDLRDPRVEHVTVTYVEVSNDLRHAKVHVSVMGDENKQSLCIHGLNHAKGFLQRKVGNRVDMRYTPQLKFMLDKGVKHSIEVEQMLSNLLLAQSEDDEIEESSLEPTSESESQE